MITIETQGVINDAGELTVHVSVPASIQPGMHSVVVVIAENPAPSSASLDEFVVHQARLASPAATLRREDLYGDDGR